MVQTQERKLLWKRSNLHKYGCTVAHVFVYMECGRDLIDMQCCHDACVVVYIKETEIKKQDQQSWSPLDCFIFRFILHPRQHSSLLPADLLLLCYVKSVAMGTPGSPLIMSFVHFHESDQSRHARTDWTGADGCVYISKFMSWSWKVWLGFITFGGGPLPP